MNINSKIQGILLLLVYICLATALLTENFSDAGNLYNVVRWTSLYAIISIGVALVIITGGIDLSIGSVVGLLGCVLAMALPSMGGPMAMLFVLALSLVIGLTHGLLITKLRLQPFIVTLCGLLIYRGVARGITGDRNLGLGKSDEGLRLLALSQPCTVAFLILLLGIALVWIAIRRIRAAANTGESTGTPASRWCLLASGVVLTVIGLSRYVGGAILALAGTEGVDGKIYATHQFDASGNWLYELLRWMQGIAVPEAGADLPGTLMWNVGLLFIPFTLWFLVIIFRADAKKALPPFLLLIVSCLLLLGSLSLVQMSDADLLAKFGMTSEKIIDDSGITIGRTHEDFPDRLRMVAVFISLGVFMAALAWLGRQGKRVGGDAAKLPMALAATTAVLFLLGNNANIDPARFPDGLQNYTWILGSTEFAEIEVPAPFFMMLAIAVGAAIFLNQTIYGRYLFALGNNEEAARFSGINVDRMKIVAYVLCSLCAGLAAILFSLDGGSVQPPNHGSFYELYAIAAAVLGGCSLRGGEGSVLGVVIAMAVIRVLYSAIGHLGIPDMVEFAIIGGVILIGVIVDEIVRRMAARRLAIQQAAEAAAEAG